MAQTIAINSRVVRETAETVREVATSIDNANGNCNTAITTITEAIQCDGADALKSAITRIYTNNENIVNKLKTTALELDQTALAADQAEAAAANLANGYYG